MLKTKAFQSDNYFWKQLEHQILGCINSMATINFMKNTQNAIFGDQFYLQYVLKISKNLSRL